VGYFQNATGIAAAAGFSGIASGLVICIFAGSCLRGRSRGARAEKVLGFEEFLGRVEKIKSSVWKNAGAF